MSYALLFEPRAAIESAQAANLREMLDLVFARHPYYRALLAARGIARGDLAGPADLARLPVTGKAEYMAEPGRFVLESDGLPEEMRTVWDTMYTTGSTAGQPTPFVSTTFDFFRILELQRNMLSLRGVRPDDVVANLFPVTRAPHGGWIRVLHACAALNVRVVSAMPGRPSEHFTLGNETEEVVRIVERSRATILWGVPSYVARVVERAIALGADLACVRMVFVTGEGLGEAARAELIAGLARCGADARISISYGSTEIQGGMVECVAGAGYHNPAPDQVLIEMVDPQTSRPVPDGEPGLVCITHLRRRGTVLLRYALGDISVRSRERCPHCGAFTDRLVAMPRRADALVKVKGMLVNPAVLTEAVEALVGARPFQATVERAAAAGPGADGDGARALAADVLRIRIGAGEAADPGLARGVADGVKSACGVTPVVEIVAPDALVDPTGPWKMKKFVDRRG